MDDEDVNFGESRTGKLIDNAYGVVGVCSRVSSITGHGASSQVCVKKFCDMHTINILVNEVHYPSEVITKRLKYACGLCAYCVSILAQ